MIRVPTALLGLVLVVGCSVDAGDLTVSIVKSWQDDENPFATAKLVRIRVDGPDLRVGPRDFDIKDRRGILPEVPIGDRRRITVEGLGFEGKKPVSRGRTGPLTIREGNNAIALYVGLLEDTGAFSYTPFKQLREARAFHTATLLDDGTVLVCGGISTPWRPESSEPMPRPSVTMERLDGNSLQVREASPPTCTTGAPRCMVSARVGHSATLLESGNVLVGGGSDGNKPVGTLSIFIPEDSRFVPAGQLTSPRLWHRAVASNSGALLVGGEAKDGLLDLGAELFSGGVVESKPGLQQGRRGFTLTLLDDGTLVAAGGVDASGKVLDTIEILSPGSPTWKTSPVPMTVPRAYHTATLEPGGTILLIGGLRGIEGTGESTASIERLDARKSTTTELSSLPRGARWAHTSTLLDDGRVLVVGGFSTNRVGSPSRTVEQITFFEDNVVQVRPLANLEQPRGGHSATLLQSGMLLIVGGVSVDESLLTKPVVSRTAVVFVY